MATYTNIRTYLHFLQSLHIFSVLLLRIWAKPIEACIAFIPNFFKVFFIDIGPIVMNFLSRFLKMFQALKISDSPLKPI